MNTITRLVLLLALGLAGITSAQAADDASRSLRVDGLERSYLLHLPPGDTRAPHPLLLVFHGGGSHARSMPRFTHLDGLADHAGMVVAYLEGVDTHWNDGRATIKHKVDDVGFVRALLDTLEREQSIDPRRIYATGISNGGIFVERLACDLSDRIVGIAAVAGTLAQDYQPACHPAQPVSVLQFDGTADPIVPYGGGKVVDFGGRGEGGLVLSVDATMAFWAGADGCMGAGPVEALPHHALLDPTRVTRRAWPGCRHGSDVALYTIEGGGHTWPGGPQYLPKLVVGRASRQIDASAVMVQFFLDHPRASSLARVIPPPSQPRLAAN